MQVKYDEKRQENKFYGTMLNFERENPSRVPILFRQWFTEQQKAVDSALFSSEDAEVLQQNLDAQQNEDDAAQDFRSDTPARTEDAADLHACGGEQKRYRADEADGRDDVDLQRRERDADGERVDAGGDGEREHGARARRGTLHIRLAEGLTDHISADQREQDERDPVVDRLDVG